MRGRAGTAPPVADEACPPQGSGPIFMARRVWKSVCRNESTSFPGNFPQYRPLIPPSVRTGVPSPQGEGKAVFVTAFHPPGLGGGRCRVRAAGGVGPYGGGTIPFSIHPAWVVIVNWPRAIRESPLRRAIDVAPHSPGLVRFPHAYQKTGGPRRPFSCWDVTAGARRCRRPAPRRRPP